MKYTFVILLASGLASALANGPAPTPAPEKRQLGGGVFGGGISNQELVNLAQQLGINLGGSNVNNLSIGQLNCDILQLLALMGLGGSVDVVGLNLNFNQQIAMIAALEQLAQIQNLGLITQNDIASLLSGSIIGNIGNITLGRNVAGNGNFNFGIFKKSLEQLKKEKRVPETLPTSTRPLHARRGHGRKRQAECTIFDGTSTQTTSISAQTSTAETTTSSTAAETTTTATTDASASSGESSSSAAEAASSTTEAAAEATAEATE